MKLDYYLQGELNETTVKKFKEGRLILSNNVESYE